MLKPFEITGSAPVEVAGTNFRRYEMKQALRVSVPRQSTQETTTAMLVPEPDNPHDPQAVSVRLDGHVIGYLPREIVTT